MTFIQRLGVSARTCQAPSIARLQGFQILSCCGNTFVVNFANSLNSELLYAVHADTLKNIVMTLSKSFSVLDSLS